MKCRSSSLAFSAPPQRLAWKKRAHPRHAVNGSLDLEQTAHSSTCSSSDSGVIGGRLGNECRLLTHHFYRGVVVSAGAIAGLLRHGRGGRNVLDRGGGVAVSAARADASVLCRRVRFGDTDLPGRASDDWPLAPYWCRKLPPALCPCLPSRVRVRKLQGALPSKNLASPCAARETADRKKN